MLTWETKKPKHKPLTNDIDWKHGPYIVLRGIFISATLRDIIFKQSQRVCPITVRDTVSDYD